MVQTFGIHVVNGLPTLVLSNNSTDTSSIYIASDPAGAQIFIDNIEQTGFRTPAMLTDIPSGYHDIKLISPGHIDIESSMPMESGRTYNLFLTMGRIEQTSNNSAGIIILLLALGLGFLLFRNNR